jgi:hypothetical protein
LVVVLIALVGSSFAVLQERNLELSKPHLVVSLRIDGDKDRSVDFTNAFDFPQMHGSLIAGLFIPTIPGQTNIMFNFFIRNDSAVTAVGVKLWVCIPSDLFLSHEIGWRFGEVPISIGPIGITNEMKTFVYLSDSSVKEHQGETTPLIMIANKDEQRWMALYVQSDQSEGQSIGFSLFCIPQSKLNTRKQAPMKPFIIPSRPLPNGKRRFNLTADEVRDTQK